jgi:geranylgeranyl pyrophosphate synthase
VVLAFEHAEAGQRARLREIYGGQDPLTPPHDEAFVRAALDGCGAQERAQREADEHRAEAVAALAAIDHDTAGLRAIADFVTERSH